LCKFAKSHHIKSQDLSDEQNTLTTNAGCPVTHYEDPQSVEAMSGISGPKKDEILNRQLSHWFRASTKLGMGIAEGLGLDMNQFKEFV